VVVVGVRTILGMVVVTVKAVVRMMGRYWKRDGEATTVEKRMVQVKWSATLMLTKVKRLATSSWIMVMVMMMTRRQTKKVNQRRMLTAINQMTSSSSMETKMITKTKS